MGIFNPDSKFSQFMSKVFDLMVLNLVFIFTSIPIFTIGVNFTALYYVTLKMVKNEEGPIAASYFRAFRNNFKKSTIIWLIGGGICLFLVLDIYLLTRLYCSSLWQLFSCLRYSLL